VETLGIEKSIQEIAEEFLERAAVIDELSVFPHEHIDKLIANNLHALTIPEEFGGSDYGMEQTSQLIQTIASGCASTALCVAMHYYTLGGLKRILSESTFGSSILRDVSKNGRFFTSFNQPNIMTIQTREAENPTKIWIKKENGGYLINGMKLFVSGCERFKYLPIYGKQEEWNNSASLGITGLLVKNDDPGVSLIESWNYSGMKGTKSHHVQFKDVWVPEERLIAREGFGVEDTQELIYWSRMAIPSVYMGIAQQAVRYIQSLAKKKKDVTSNKNLGFMPGVQFAYSDMLVKLETSKNQLAMYAKQADAEIRQGKFSNGLYEQSLITKQYVTKSSNEIVWMAMQIEGMSSMNHGGLLERLYRDVRAATFHQPSEDLLKELLAKRSLGIITVKNRWC
jgi:alkylation response protein AidB-like acyl-CoA dehydrogenase